MYKYEDFYREPSEFECQIDEFKASLMAAVKQEHQEEVERLRKENAELRPVKKRMRQIEMERNSEKHELERVKRDALKEAKKMRLTELLKDYKAAIYTFDSVPIRKPKCDKCDDDRRIPYTTPLGKPAKEDCTCREFTYAYKVREVMATSLEHYSPDGSVQVNYYDDEREEKIFRHMMYKPENGFKSVTDWTYFEDKKDAQAYCDWKTAKKKQKVD
jgi:hypothetical protein